MFERRHESDQPADACLRHGVIQAGPDAALGGMSMQVVQAVLRRLLDKGVGQSWLDEPEADIDRRAVRRMLSAAIESAGIDVPVELATSALCCFVHRRETAVLADPAQHQPGHIERKGRWGIETALLLGLDSVTECRGQVARRPSQ